MSKSNLTPAERSHYSRHLKLREVGEAGQLRLKHASVLLVGAGGLGSPLALYLAAAGIGRLGIVEFDLVDATNLHRQVLYGESQIGELKLDSAVARLRDLNPHIRIEPHAFRLEAANARELVRNYDLVADGADNFATRYLVNDACVLEGKPLVSASILGFEGQLTTFHHEGGPCYRCLYSEPPPPGEIPDCAEGGVLGVLPGVLGTLQATEVIKIVLGLGNCLQGRLLTYDALGAAFSEFKIFRNPDCAICGDRPTIRELVDYERLCGSSSAGIREVTPDELRRRLNDPALLILDVREASERAACRIDPSIHIPLQKILSGESLPDRDREIIVYCQAGARSWRAAGHLAARGYSRVASLAGGMDRWLSEPRP